MKKVQWISLRLSLGDPGLGIAVTLRMRLSVVALAILASLFLAVFATVLRTSVP